MLTHTIDAFPFIVVFKENLKSDKLVLHNRIRFKNKRKTFETVFFLLGFMRTIFL